MCKDAVKAYLAWIASEAYVREAAHAEAFKNSVESIYTNILQEITESVETAPWMNNTIRQKSREVLGGARAKIGYPEWLLLNEKSQYERYRT